MAQPSRQNERNDGSKIYSYASKHEVSCVRSNNHRIKNIAIIKTFNRNKGEIRKGIKMTEQKVFLQKKIEKNNVEPFFLQQKTTNTHTRTHTKKA